MNDTPNGTVESFETNNNFCSEYVHAVARHMFTMHNKVDLADVSDTEAHKLEDAQFAAIEEKLQAARELIDQAEVAVRHLKASRVIAVADGLEK